VVLSEARDARLRSKRICLAEGKANKTYEVGLGNKEFTPITREQELRSNGFTQCSAYEVR